MPFDSIEVEQYFNVGEEATAWLAERPPNDQKIFFKKNSREEGDFHEKWTYLGHHVELDKC